MHRWISVVGALLASAVLAGTAAADTQVTLTPPVPPPPAPCTDLIDIGCAISTSSSDISIAFTFPTADFAAPNDWCFTPDSSGNVTTLDFGNGDVLTLRTTQFCLKSPVGDLSGNLGGQVSVVSGTGNYAGATGSGTFSGTYTADSLLFLDSQMTFSSYSLAVTLPVTTCDPLDPTCSGSGGGPGVGSTPELDSLTLFGSALLSLGAYAALRRRARRSRD
jgi:hypothetical protein